MKRSLFNKPGLRRGLMEVPTCTQGQVLTDVKDTPEDPSDDECVDGHGPAGDDPIVEADDDYDAEGDAGADSALGAQGADGASGGAAPKAGGTTTKPGATDGAGDATGVQRGNPQSNLAQVVGGGATNPNGPVSSPAQIDAEIQAAETVPDGSGWSGIKMVNGARMDGGTQISVSYPDPKTLPKGVTYDKETGLYSGDVTEAMAQQRFHQIESALTQSEGLSPYKQQLMWQTAVAANTRQGTTDYAGVINTINAWTEPGGMPSDLKRAVTPVDPRGSYFSPLRAGSQAPTGTEERNNMKRETLEAWLGGTDGSEPTVQMESSPEDVAAYLQAHGYNLERTHQAFVGGGGVVGDDSASTGSGGDTSAAVSKMLTSEGVNPTTGKKEKLMVNGDDVRAAYERRRNGYTDPETGERVPGLSERAEQARADYERSTRPGPSAEAIDGEIAARQAALDAEMTKPEAERDAELIGQITAEKQELEAARAQAVEAGPQAELAAQYQALDTQIADRRTAYKVREAEVEAMPKGRERTAAQLELGRMGRELKGLQNDREKLDRQNPFRRTYDDAQKELDDFDRDMADATQTLNTRQIGKLTGEEPILSASGQEAQKAAREAKNAERAARWGGTAADTWKGGPGALLTEFGNVMTTAGSGIDFFGGLASGKTAEGLKTERRKAVSGVSEKQVAEVDTNTNTRETARQAERLGFGKEGGGLIAAFKKPDKETANATALAEKAKKDRKGRTESFVGVHDGIAANAENYTKVSAWYTAQAKADQEKAEADRDEANAADTSRESSGLA